MLTTLLPGIQKHFPSADLGLGTMPSELAYTVDPTDQTILLSYWHTQPPFRPILLLPLYYKNSTLNSTFNLPSLPQY